MDKSKNKKILLSRSRKNGFTLTETLFASSIAVLILLALTLLAKNIFNYNSFISFSLQNTSIERKALKTISSEIRTASSANTGAYAINQASSTSFTFYADIYDNGLKEKVRYFLNGSLLQKGITIPTGSPLDYTGAETITTILSNVTNASIFNYYDGNYDGTTAALASPVDISSIRLIKITVTTDANTSLPPPAETFSTQVSLRNLKDNL